MNQEFKVSGVLVADSENASSPLETTTYDSVSWMVPDIGDYTGTAGTQFKLQGSTTRNGTYQDVGGDAVSGLAIMETQVMNNCIFSFGCETNYPFVKLYLKDAIASGTDLPISGLLSR